MVFDPRIPERELCVLGHQLERWAKQRPSQTAIIFDGGETWTWAEALALTQRAAKGLQDLGVSKGDHVLSWQPNNREAVLTWFGLNYLGAVYVPMNTAYRGSLLEHTIALSDARLMICHAGLADRLADVDTAAVTDIVITQGDADLPRHTVHSASALLPDVGLSAMPDLVEPWDTQYIIFTSGTTGPSKAVLSSYAQGYAMGPTTHGAYLDETDRFLINLPLFHVGGTVYVILTLGAGGSCFIDTHFKTDQFWNTVRTHKLTNTCLLAAMIPFLLKRPPAEDDTEHSLRTAICVPWNEDAMELGRRHGIEMRTTFNMTEVSSPMLSDPWPPEPGTCGQVRDGVEARVVDANDCEVAPGEVGELILRTEAPWALNHGYYKNPEATVEAWRNGWFHTGDAFRYDEDGYFYFVDRIKDAIRRRGENISSFEIESEVHAHPDVKEAAAIAAPSDLGDDEVMIVVAPIEGRSVDPQALLEFLQPRMARFMLPRYIRMIDELPKTPTQKVQKHILKTSGITDDTWDREAAGVVLAKDRV